MIKTIKMPVACLNKVPVKLETGERAEIVRFERDFTLDNPYGKPGYNLLTNEGFWEINPDFCEKVNDNVFRIWDTRERSMLVVLDWEE